MRVVVQVTKTCRELEEELEQVPLRDRAEFIRCLAMQGLCYRRQAMAGQPQGPAATPAAPPSGEEKRRSLKGLGMASLEEG